MKTCYKCNVKVKPSRILEDGVYLNCLKCPKCGEEYIRSGEIIKHDILTGKRKMVRKFGVIGDSMVMRIPTHVLKEYKIKPGDYGLFENRSEGILIKPIHAKDLET